MTSGGKDAETSGLEVLEASQLSGAVVADIVSVSAAQV